MNRCCHNARIPFYISRLLLFVHGCNLLRGSLHNVVASRTLDPILVGIVVNHGKVIAEIVMRGRGGGRAPLQRSRFPRIIAGWRASEPAVDQVIHKDQLGSAGDEGGDGDELMHRNERSHKVSYKCRIAAYISGHTQVMEWHE